MVWTWQMTGYGRAYATDVPERAGVYALVRTQRVLGLPVSLEVLYAGKAVNLRRRFRQHAGAGEPNPSLAGLCTSAGISGFEFWWVPVARDAHDDVERELIRAIGPSANRIRYGANPTTQGRATKLRPAQ